ncbi:MAG: hypothetical protein FWF02_01150 [Micrococcales bacterium]|nr:hypothetical protein [Micrococcales bacterium]MCL2666302.1 hypothetical protein [Micrococcales bacterium]
MRRGHTLAIVTALALAVGLVAVSTPPPAQAASTTPLLSGTGMVRAGHVWLSAGADETVSVDWKPVWAADGNAEQLYLVNPAGSLSAQVDIPAGTAASSRTLNLAKAAGDYTLAVPGYSFRSYQVTAGPNTAIQLEPTKVHPTAQLAAGTQLYFRVGANQQATLCGKYHGGVSSMQAVRVSDNTSANLALRSYSQYPQYDKVSLPVSATDQVWRVTFGGSGKAAFWLDGTANLFAPKAEHLHPLALPTGQATVTVGTTKVGPSPHVGVAMPYYAPPASAVPTMNSLGLDSASYYTFHDAGAANEVSFRKYYKQTMGITTDVTLLAGTNRSSVISTSAAASGVDKFVSTMKQVNGGTHYLSFADEPNLNFTTYAAYAAYFDSALRRLESTSGAREAGVRVAVPASSRFVGAPFRTDSNFAANRGIVWTQQLLNTYGDRIDAVAWHEWAVRDLLATRQYRDSIKAAADMVGTGPDGRPAKSLLIDQTNISSGTDLSPYEQDTQYAALWWTSVVVNSSADGTLEVLNWFKIADEGSYPKGMLNESGTKVKPVGAAQQFISDHWGGQVYQSSNTSFEVDAVQLGEGSKRVLLGVNKSDRAQQVTISGAVCQAQVELLGPDSKRRTATVDCQGGAPRLAVPAQTIFAVTWNA